MTRTTAIAFAIFVFAGMGLRQVRAFDYFEHRYLGNMAYQKALEDYKDSPFLGTINDVTRKHLGFGVAPAKPEDLYDRSLKKLPVQFGDLSALAGDLTRDIDDLKKVLRGIAGRGNDFKQNFWMREKAFTLVLETRRQWFSTCKWIYRARKDLARTNDPKWAECFASLADTAGFAANPTSKFGSEGYRASRGELAAYEAIPEYVSLAAENRDHFPRYSWKAYSKHHTRALELADCYRKEIPCSDSSGSDEALLVEALLNEGFAQHYCRIPLQLAISGPYTVSARSTFCFFEYLLGNFSAYRQKGERSKLMTLSTNSGWT